MIIDEINLTNFGVFGGRQHLRLTPPSDKKPVILIGGLNGAGKTTLIDAIHLGLYGPIAKCSNRGALSYQEFLRRCVHGHARTEETNIEIVFRYRTDGKERSYRIIRSWEIKNSRVRERFDVLLDGKKDPVLTANWLNQVHEFFPPNIAHLFLFDGEKIEGYVGEDDSADLIGSAIENLLGLDIVDQLHRDLETLERRKRTELHESETQEKIETIEGELAILKSQLEGLIKERANNAAALNKKQSALKKVESQYRKLGGVLFDKRQLIEDRKVEAEQTVKLGQNSLREIASSELPLLLVKHLLDNMAKQDANEEASRLNRGLLNTLENRDSTFLKQIKKLSNDGDLVESIRQMQLQDRRSRKERVKIRAYLQLSTEAQIRLKTLREESLTSVFRTSQSLLEKQEQLELDLSYTSTEYANIPAPDTLANVLKRRERQQSGISDTETEINVLDGSIGRLQRDIERKHLEHAKLLNENAELCIKSKDRDRILSYTSKVQGTIKQFRMMVIQRHLRRIEELVLQSYKHLLHKTSLVDRLTIDPDRFNLTLFDKEDNRIQIQRLSAGERQLLGVALLWGLGKASGRPLPTAIDTPLGRLDTTHRSHLVEHYFPYASHQVLLLSTDEEISGEYLRKLNPWIGQRYQLVYDDVLGRTQVNEGYFEGIKQTHVN
ncbi:MAG: DNA sulfur modification protein DndD [Gemmatimonadetes bacterium]|nr:DNA sulfur modification protein DndD [Gemmatimonadota bacterium]MYB62284.1 DNA sulfur modification protein DndD [Gemmatimonadota bacterium]